MIRRFAAALIVAALAVVVLLTADASLDLSPSSTVSSLDFQCVKGRDGAYVGTKCGNIQPCHKQKVRAVVYNSKATAYVVRDGPWRAYNGRWSTVQWKQSTFDSLHSYRPLIAWRIAPEKCRS